MVTKQIGSQLFPLSTITFILDVPVIINIQLLFQVWWKPQITQEKLNYFTK